MKKPPFVYTYSIKTNGGLQVLLDDLNDCPVRLP